MTNREKYAKKILECRKTEKGVLLSDILEDEVPQKYFLSKEQTGKIVFKQSAIKTDTEEIRISLHQKEQQKHLILDKAVKEVIMLHCRVSLICATKAHR